MRIMLLAAPLAFLATPAAADPHAAFHGSWGTAQQCARAPLKPGGTVMAAPVEIDARWLKQGRLWCSLNWGPVEARADGLFTAANVLCGEDSVRGYFLGMTLSGDALTLRWDFARLNGPLTRCPGS